MNDGREKRVKINFFTRNLINNFNVKADHIDARGKIIHQQFLPNEERYSNYGITKTCSYMFEQINYEPRCLLVSSLMKTLN